MDSSTCKLDSLPVEIIATIASFTPAENVISLSTANVRLRSICYDPLIFRSCIEHNALLGSGKHLSSPKETKQTSISKGLNLETLSELLGSSTQAWARLAVADSLAVNWSNRYVNDDALKETGQASISRQLSSRFVPHLLVLGCNSLTTQVAETVFDSLESIMSSQANPYMHAVHLGNPSRPITRRANLEGINRIIALGLNDSASAFWYCTTAFSDQRAKSETIMKQMNYTFVNRCEHSDYTKADASSSMATLSTWAWLLKDYLEAHPVDGTQGQPSNGRAARFVPRLQDFPWYGKLREGDKIPLPFMHRDDFNLKVDSKYRLVCWDDWLRDQCEKMSHPSYLTQSTWCGYWSFERHRRFETPSIEFADAVEGLTIQALHFVDAPEPNTRRLIGTYTEHVIDFHLEGYITPRGQFKLGPPGEFWAWFGWMTPFGMFGFWGSADGEQSAGACWLWQSRWTEEANKKRGAPGSDDDDLADSDADDEAETTTDIE